jgi:hypothetical protein
MIVQFETLRITIEVLIHILIYKVYFWLTDNYNKTNKIIEI